jgi:hypothetical protein
MVVLVGGRSLRSRVGREKAGRASTRVSTRHAWGRAPQKAGVQIKAGVEETGLGVG